MPFKVGKGAGVGARMRMLADRASLAGIRQAYVEALQRILTRLEGDPLGWGNPLYKMHHQGGIVCVAITAPIAVHYSIHEVENSVIILDIKPLFDWPVRP